jgi:hypothetical protein
MIFFLTSKAYMEFWEIRQCESIETGQFPTKTVQSGFLPSLWVKISPPLDGKRLGIADRLIDTVLLVSHNKPKDFYSLKGLPLIVYLYIPSDLDHPLKDIPLDHTMTGFDEVEIHGTKESAEAAVKKYRELSGYGSN